VRTTPLSRVSVGAEGLDVDEGVVAGVLHVVAEIAPYDADVAGREVHRVGVGTRVEHGHPPRSFQVVLPLVRVGVPVQLTHPTGLDRRQSGGDGRGGGEVGAVGDLDLSAAVLVHGRGLPETEDHRFGPSLLHAGGELVGFEVAGDLSGEDPEIVERDVGEHLFRDPEVQLLPGRVSAASR
jgi:hypothetical protein